MPKMLWAGPTPTHQTPPPHTHIVRSDVAHLQIMYTSVDIVRDSFWTAMNKHVYIHHLPVSYYLINSLCNLSNLVLKN